MANLLHAEQGHVREADRFALADEVEPKVGRPDPDDVKAGKAHHGDHQEFPKAAFAARLHGG